MDAQIKSASYKALIPIFFILIAFLIQIKFNLYVQGIQPLNFNKIWGIFTWWLPHKDANHVILNCIPLFVLGIFVFRFHAKNSWYIYLFSIVFAGLLTWLIASKGTHHIGASGLVYALTFYLMIYGFLVKERKHVIVSLLVVVLYGSSVWGIFPNEPNVSWEGHASGAVAGLLAALFVIYTQGGIQKKGPYSDPYSIFDYRNSDKD